MNMIDSTLENQSVPVTKHSKLPPLDALFSPATIAVIGASETPGSVGESLMKNLAVFEGKVIAVNPRHASIKGIAAYPSVAAVPEAIDLAVIATPAATVPGVLRECVRAGVPAAIVISAGFRECGAKGLELERQCLAEAARGKMRLLGPNCLGLMVPRARLNATFAEGIAQPGSVAFLSQSGALCSAVLDWSFRESIGFSAFVSVGSMADVSWGELLTYFGDDPHTKSIVCYMESIGDARAFLSAAREVALTKPIIVLKVGHTQAAARAAASHTGALTGSDAVLDAAFRRVGVLRVNTIGELFSMAELLAKQPRPRGPHLSIVTNAGGPGALATDALVSSGGVLAELWPDTCNGLNHLLPQHWSHGNPIDVLGDADPARYAKAVELAMHDPQSDGVLVVLTPQAMTHSEGTAKAIRELARHSAKPILASWMGGGSVDAGRAVLNAANIPTFEHPDTAARAFALMWRYAENLRSLYETPNAVEASPKSAEARLWVEELITAVRRSGRTLLTEMESKEVLKAYGIPTVDTFLAFTEDEAVGLAQRLGFPLVVKLHSETLTHKAEVGGVVLDVASISDVRHAWKVIQKGVTERVGAHHFLGVTVQPMVPRGGFELILGSSIDSQFGPVLLFGTGGSYVESLKDTVIGLPPLNRVLARRLMEQTRAFEVLKRLHGASAVDLDALEQILVRFSQLILEQPWIAEIDVNPLLITAKGIQALDARIVTHSSNAKDADLPRPAIRPYPSRYIKQSQWPDGSQVTIRPIRPEDEPHMVRFHQTLSDQTVYQRYLSPLKLETRIEHQRLSRICFIDYDRDMVLVAERHEAGTPEPEIMAVGRLSRVHGRNEAEFALLVADRWQRRGLGKQLLTLLVQIGRDEKLDRIQATLLADNVGMQRTATAVGFGVHAVEGGSEWRADLPLS